MIYLPKLKINKYSLYELKIGIDTVIENYLYFQYFEENLKLNNIKIILILLAILCAGIAHLFSKPFPDNYYIIFFSVFFYLIFKTIYWFIENKLTNSIFFIGNNLNYCNKLRKNKNKHYTIKEIKFHSAIDEKNPSVYEIWFDFKTLENNKTFISKKRKINCTAVYDERGYIHQERVIKSFKSIFKKEIRKID